MIKIIMFLKLIIFTKKLIISKPITATVVSFTGGSACGCMITSFYMKKEQEILKEKLKQLSEKKAKGGNISDKIKRITTIVTDETIDYVGKGFRSNPVYRMGDKIVREFSGNSSRPQT